MLIGKNPSERLCKARSRTMMCRTASLSLGLSVCLFLTFAPRIALAENAQAENPDLLSEVFGLEETDQTAQAGQTQDQTDPRNGSEQAAQAEADNAVTALDMDTNADTASSSPDASEKSTPTSKSTTPAKTTPDAQNTPTDSAVPSTAAGANGRDVEGGTEAATEAIEVSPQTAAPAGQNSLENPAAGLVTATAQTGNSGQADNNTQTDKPEQADNTRAAARVWDERTGIVTPGTAGRVVHVFGASIPTLVCQPGMVCLMELEAGEEVLDTPIQADPARWRVELRHRDRPVSQTYFAFKPSEDAAARTNFVVLTDRRVYVVNLVKDLLRSTYILSFDYPDTRARTMAAEIEARSAAKRAARAAAHTHRTRAIARTGVNTTRGAVPASELDFNYSIRGTAPFKPLRVYNDGRKTYVDLPIRYRGDLPVVIGGAAEDNKAFNYRVARNGTQFIIDRVLRDFVLQDGRRSIRIRRGS